MGFALLIEYLHTEMRPNEPEMVAAEWLSRYQLLQRHRHRAAKLIQAAWKRHRRAKRQRERRAMEFSEEEPIGMENVPLLNAGHIQEEGSSRKPKMIPKGPNRVIRGTRFVAELKKYRAHRRELIAKNIPFPRNRPRPKIDVADTDDTADEKQLKEQIDEAIKEAVEAMEDRLYEHISQLLKRNRERIVQELTD